MAGPVIKLSPSVTCGYRFGVRFPFIGSSAIEDIVFTSGVVASRVPTGPSDAYKDS